MRYQKNSATKTKSYKKSASLLIALILVIVVGTGTTLAYIVDTTGTLSNIFTPSNVACAVNDDKSIENTGNVDAYIRAAVVATWKDTSGNVYGGSKPTVSITPESGWAQKNDGYYYYSSAVTVGSSTEPLIDTYTCSNTAPDGYYSLSIEVVAEAIQSKPASAVDSWDNDKVNVTGNNIGTELTVTNK